ncbi:MAG TPA: hypothetical protein VMW69_10625 [Spirochaetia bacterium]|nr:hypothetical protein [Spirochaetia bacterium]
MSGSDSKVQRQLEERILGTLGISHGKVVLGGTKFDFDGFANGEVFEIYAGIEKLRSGQQQKISQDVLKMILYEKMLGTPVKKVIVVIDKEIHDSLSFAEHRSWKNRAIVEYGVEVRFVPISAEERLMLVNAKKEQGEKFKNAT